MRIFLSEIAKAWSSRMPLSELARILGVSRDTLEFWLAGGVPQAALCRRLAGNNGGVSSMLDKILRGLAEWDEAERKVISLLPATSRIIRNRTGIEIRRINAILRSLERRGLVERDGNRWRLTEEGWREAILTGAKKPSWSAEIEFEVGA
jgi:transcriptional regulator with XRE-family HTH domain